MVVMVFPEITKSQPKYRFVCFVVGVVVIFWAVTIIGEDAGSGEFPKLYIDFENFPNHWLNCCNADSTKSPVIDLP